MTKRRTTAGELHREWMQEPGYAAAYEARESEYALANALIEARSRANMTQEDVAAKMGTTQTAIARLEGGRIMPTTRTLQRFAAATGTHLRIHFEPEKPGQSAAR